MPVPARVNHCPSCDGQLQVRELYCPTCDIQLRGNFETRGGGPLARLTEDQLAFLRLFVTSRGNLSDIERTLGVSYPTVRAKLDDLIGAMDEPAAQPSPAAAAPSGATAGATSATTSAQAPTRSASGERPSRREILARIADGRMSPQDGFAALKQTPADEA